MVAYDQGNGAYAARLWWLLRWLGHRKVAVLNGGVAAWQQARLPTEVTATVRAPRVFSPRPESVPVVSTAEVERMVAAGDLNVGGGAGAAGSGGESASTTAGGAAGGKPVSGAAKESAGGSASAPGGGSTRGWVLVDARAADRFAGANETIDPVAGHIPGARNHAFLRNVDTQGRFLAADELRERWRVTLGDAAAAQVIAMCGSGVTACHNLLALEVAGLAGARLYAGSWSEWIRDPSRALVR